MIETYTIGGFEATLFRECKIRLAAVCFVDNLANGIKEELTVTTARNGVEKGRDAVNKIIEAIMSNERLGGFDPFPALY